MASIGSYTKSGPSSAGCSDQASSFCGRGSRPSRRQHSKHLLLGDRPLPTARRESRRFVQDVETADQGDSGNRGGITEQLWRCRFRLGSRLLSTSAISSCKRVRGGGGRGTVGMQPLTRVPHAPLQAPPPPLPWQVPPRGEGVAPRRVRCEAPCCNLCPLPTWPPPGRLQARFAMLLRDLSPS
jgi:hypothetical protein